MKSLMEESVTKVERPTKNLTKLSNVIGEPTKPCTWNEDTEVVPGCCLRGCGPAPGESPYLSSIGISEKWSSRASLIGL
jgi:hypothetical protein